MRRFRFSRGAVDYVGVMLVDSGAGEEGGELSAQISRHGSSLCERPCVDIVKTDTYSEQLSSCCHHGGAAPAGTQSPTAKKYFLFGHLSSSDLKSEPFQCKSSSVG